MTLALGWMLGVCGKQWDRGLCPVLYFHSLLVPAVVQLHTGIPSSGHRLLLPQLTGGGDVGARAASAGKRGAPRPRREVSVLLLPRGQGPGVDVAGSALMISSEKRALLGMFL